MHDIIFACIFVFHVSCLISCVLSSLPISWFTVKDGLTKESKETEGLEKYFVSTGICSIHYFTITEGRNIFRSTEVSVTAVIKSGSCSMHFTKTGAKKFICFNRNEFSPCWYEINLTRLASIFFFKLFLWTDRDKVRRDSLESAQKITDNNDVF